MAEASPDTTAPAPPENGPSKATPSRDESISDYAEQSDLPTYTSYQCAHTLTGHTRAVSSVRFSHSGASLASASADGTARVWDADTGSCLHVLQGHSKVGVFKGGGWPGLGWCQHQGQPLRSLVILTLVVTCPSTPLATHHRV